jgi:hypothetical protein
LVDTWYNWCAIHKDFLNGTGVVLSRDATRRQHIVR